MFAWRLDGPIEFNAGAERLYGFARNEAVGRNSDALLQTNFPIDFAELYSQLLDMRYWSGDLHHVHKDGSEVLVESCMQLLSDGIPGGMFGKCSRNPRFREFGDSADWAQPRPRLIVRTPNI